MDDLQVIILCGGKGTRSYPFTEYFPKAMMPIGGAPILVHLMRIYAFQGVTNFVIAAGHRKEILLDYFAGRFLDWKIQIVDTGETSDTAERIRRCLPFVGGRFFVTYGDGLGNVDLGQLLELHVKSKASATLTAVPLRSQYGTIHFSAKRRVERFQEKPVISDCWINAGFFLFEREVFDRWHGDNLERDVLPELAEQARLFVNLHNGFWRSMDTSKDQQELEEVHAAGGPPWMQFQSNLRDGHSNGDLLAVEHVQVRL